MLKKTITYEDYNGETRTEDFYFNLTQTELLEMEYTEGSSENFSDILQVLIHEQDAGSIIRVIKKVLLASYGEKSTDGRRFVKNQDIQDAFEQNPAFDVLYMELANDAKAAAEFFTGLMPKAVTSQLGDDPSKALMEKVKDNEAVKNALESGSN